LTGRKKKATIRGVQSLQFMLQRQTRFTPLAWAAVLCCLLAGASIHSHASGWHTMHNCTLCAFEDAVAHGAATALSAHAVTAWHVLPHVSLVRHIAELPQRNNAPIRAPPLFS